MAPKFILTTGQTHIFEFRPRHSREACPCMVLSSQEYNRKTGLLICCPISTSIRGAATEVPISHLEEPSVVAASLVQTLSWRERKVKKIITASQEEFRETLLRLLLR